MSPDETETLNRFVDRIERRKVAGYNESSVADVVSELTEEGISYAEAIEKPVSESGLPKYVMSVLSNGGYRTFGDLYSSMKQDPDAIFKLQGVTPKVMSEVATLVKYISWLETKETEVPEEAPTVDLAETAASEITETASVDARVDDEPVEDFVDLTQLPIVVEEPQPEPETAEEFEDVSFDELFNQMRSEIVAPVDYSEDEEMSDDSGGRKGKKKKKKKNVEIEYDPDSDSTLVRKKHKRGEDEDWGW